MKLEKEKRKEISHNLRVERKGTDKSDCNLLFAQTLKLFFDKV